LGAYYLNSCRHGNDLKVYKPEVANEEFKKAYPEFYGPNSLAADECIRHGTSGDNEATNNIG